jgi:hypothetical protein
VKKFIGCHNCFMGGNTALILDDILATGTGYVVCNVETNQQRFVDRLCETHPHVNVRINMDPRIVACRDASTIYGEVDRILTIADGRRNCLMGTGCLPLRRRRRTSADQNICPEGHRRGAPADRNRSFAPSIIGARTSTFPRRVSRRGPHRQPDQAGRSTLC